MIEGKHPTIVELWVVYVYYFLCPPIQDPYFLHILQANYIQPVSRLQLHQFNAH